MAVVTRYRSISSKRGGHKSTPADRLRFIQGSFSPKNIFRQYPVLAALHRVTDGALVGALIAVAMMTTLTLHWQHLWTVAFSRMEATRDLTHRLTESSAMLERHLLESTSLPMSMVPTKPVNLLYLNSPYVLTHPKADEKRKFLDIKRLVYNPVNHGY